MICPMIVKVTGVTPIPPGGVPGANGPKTSLLESLLLVAMAEVSTAWDSRVINGWYAALLFVAEQGERIGAISSEVANKVRESAWNAEKWSQQ